MYLAALRTKDRRATSAEIALRFNVSTNHLVKAVNDLARLGYVRTSRGPGGGIQLARSADDIQLGDFIEAFQGPLMLHECAATKGVCVIQSFCNLRSIFAQADGVQKEFLNRFTLSDFIPPRSKLKALPSTT